MMKRERAALILVASALAVRCVVFVSTRDDAVFRVPYLDGAFYHVWARSLAEGHGDFVGPYFLAPAYPYVLSWLYRIFGASLEAVRVFQTLLGVVDVVLVLALARRMFGPNAGLWAAALFALQGVLVFYEGVLVLEPLLVTLTLSAFAALVLASPVRSRHAIVAGLLFGAATLARGTALLAAPFVLAYLWRRRARHALVLACVWSATLLPVLVRNVQHDGSWVLTTNAGVNFYAGNQPGANGRFRPPPGVQFFTAPLAHAEIQGELPSAVAARALTVEAVAGSADAARSSLWFARAWDWIRDDPGAFIVLSLRKLGLVLQGREIAQIESVAFHQARLPALRLLFVNLSWILPLAVLGIWRTRAPGSPQRWLTLAMIVATLLPCVVFFVTARYRLVALPYLALFAGAGAASLWNDVRTRHGRALLQATVLCGVVAAATRLGAQPPRSAPGWSNAQMAERVYALGDLEAAIRYQEEAARWLPERTAVQLNLALYWSERNTGSDLERAEQLLRRLAERAPEQPVVLFNLGVILEQRGRVDEARRVWERVLQLDPTFGPARERLRSGSSATTPRPGAASEGRRP